ncbi:D-alanine--poly(phosphoribitol) ligase subunit 2 [Stieleria maiorica]|uniref:D-alanine--poly(Phosphoribitol) ligase subunit 2 n=1 Tax=Stieleria maiorica TaxID=2795974 RepID=A0A5B9MI08_9BACT|nr:acyl carrier protein [Stieleria maiorica]QEF99630.1 D-alanine--poly(phosphoribitol) ligase subunit 2 [Stieleria maiorica]
MQIDRNEFLKYLDEKMGVDTSEIEGDTALFSSGILDSFSMVDVVMFIEKSAQTKLRPGEVNLENLDSVDRIINFIETRQDD